MKELSCRMEHAVVVLAVAVLIAGCRPAATNSVQGYVEGEFVHIGSPIGGMLSELKCKRGGQVQAGETLFVLESGKEEANLAEAKRKLAQARATLEDLKKGKRPSEMESLSAQLKQARAALELSEKELARAEELARTQVATEQELDRARTVRDQDRQRVVQLEAELETARLGARADQVEAAEANVRASEAALARAQWELDQKTQKAPTDALVFDTLYREGEWVPAGRPVISLLPPGNLKVRAFVPQARLSTLHVGESARVSMDGLAQAVTGTISYISPQAEFTPPVIYSRETRDKLVFMVELSFAPEIGGSLHPGQPVDVSFGEHNEK